MQAARAGRLSPPAAAKPLPCSDCAPHLLPACLSLQAAESERAALEEQVSLLSEQASLLRQQLQKRDAEAALQQRQLEQSRAETVAATQRLGELREAVAAEAAATAQVLPRGVGDVVEPGMLRCCWASAWPRPGAAFTACPACRAASRQMPASPRCPSILMPTIPTDRLAISGSFANSMYTSHLSYVGLTLTHPQPRVAPTLQVLDRAEVAARMLGEQLLALMQSRGASGGGGASEQEGEEDAALPEQVGFLFSHLSVPSAHTQGVPSAVAVLLRAAGAARPPPPSLKQPQVGTSGFRALMHRHAYSRSSSGPKLTPPLTLDLPLAMCRARRPPAS